MSDMDNDIKPQELVDPLQLVPNETFCKLISFLPPHSIAHSSAVSSQWRSVVNSDSTLHREIDLIPKDETQLTFTGTDLYRLDQLASLALYQVVKISFSLNSLYLVFRITSDSNRKGIDDLSRALKDAGRNNSLQEIRFVLRLSSEQYQFRPGQADDKLIPFLIEILRGLKGHQRLRKVVIEAPMGISIEVEEFKIVDNGLGFNAHQYENQNYASLMREVKALAGKGLTSFEGSTIDSSVVSQVIVTSYLNPGLVFGSCDFILLILRGFILEGYGIPRWDSKV